MSLRFLGALEITPFGVAVANANGAANPTEIQGMDAGTTQLFGSMYCVNRNRYFCNGFQSGGVNGNFSIEPNFLDQSASNYLRPPSSPESDGDAFMCMGQPDLQTLAQTMYCGRNADVVRRLNVDTLSQTQPAFTGANGDFVINTGGIAAATPGGWVSFENIGIFFEGLTDGIPGVTPLVGANVYPQGLFLSQVHDGTPLSDSVRRFGWPAWIDIDLRRAVAVVPDIASRVTTTVTEPFYETPIDGDTFDWAFAQYIPDTDATLATPKGLLLQHNRSEIPIIAGGVGVLRTYVRFTDFNPFGVASAVGVPTRTNGRIRLNSRCLANVGPHFDLAGQATLQNPTGIHIFFDSKNGRFVQFMGTLAAGTVGDPNRCTVGFFLPVADPVIITQPIAREVSRTNDIIDYDSAVLGDLGERINGQIIDWTLTRRSTELEVLDASTFPGTSTVVNAPIDESVPAANEGTLSVIADGVPLVETTDYTVVLSTGVITWVTDQSGATVVTATYEHRLTPAAPPNDATHGTLLADTSISDENGVVTTRILVPDDDDLVGTIDDLDAEFPP